MSDHQEYRDRNGNLLPTDKHGRPLCPQCMRRDRVLLPSDNPRRITVTAFCDRCLAALWNLEVPPKKYLPDFEDD